MDLSEDAKKLIERANKITKQERYVIKWNNKKRTATMTIKAYPETPLGHFKITKVKPL